ncbi:zinc finger and SCAN domain-containing protein 29-like [Gopherus flavomarginatus]|uniref:zinc finger and SCAN domain-containing protein 29-like n=1 Tax=Gopherus flavomarginatus TaxID=286002 RepID=UPI0021CC08CA|nr:zinc finger and SCAN domain-containing protein 29-like [Gopherus flavomarginatus]
MPPRAKRAPAWSNGELLDLISVCREEAVRSQLHSSHRNYDTYGQISRAMLERGHDRDALLCRVKVKELRSAYCKARKGNRCYGAAPTTCHFYKELDTILGGDPTANLRTTMDTSERRRKEEEEGGRRKPRVRVLEWGETPRSPRRHAARSSSQARRKAASRSSRYLVKNKQRSGFPQP